MFTSAIFASALALCATSAPVEPLSFAVIAEKIAALQPVNAIQADGKPTIFNSTRATWYYPHTGSCGVARKVDDHVASISTAAVNTTKSLCGEKITVTDVKTNKSVDALITDECDGCDANYINLSPSAFKLIAPLVEGVFEATYKFATNDTVATASVHQESKPKTLAASKPSTTAVAQAKNTPSTKAASTPKASTPKNTTPKAAAQVATTPKNSSPKATTKAASTTSASSNSAPKNQAVASTNSGSLPYGGTATWYTQGGNAGACGKVNSDSAYIVALQTNMYSGGSNCGRTIRMCNNSNGKCANAQVADLCPSCGASQNVDLSTGLFQAIGPDMSAGVFQMSWGFV